MKNKIKLTTVLILFFVILSGFTPADRRKIENMVDADNFAAAVTYLDNYISAEPRDNEARFWLARILSWSGHYTRALAEYDKLLADEPENSDYLLGKARVLYWSGRVAEAFPLLHKGRKHTPGYRDIYKLELSLLAVQGESQEFEKLASEARERFEDFDAPDFSENIIRPWKFGVEYEYSSVNSGYSNWKSEELFLSREFSNSQFLNLSANRSEKFDKKDYQFAAAYSVPLSEQFILTTSGNYSTTARILPEWSLYGQLGYKITDQIIFSPGVRRSDYGDTVVKLYDFTLEKYWFDYRFAYTFTRSELETGASGNNHRLHIDYFYRYQSRLGVGIYKGKEVEQVAFNNILRTDVEGLYLRGEHYFNQEWGIIYQFDYHDQGDFYTRRGSRAGIIHRF